MKSSGSATIKKKKNFTSIRQGNQVPTIFWADPEKKESYPAIIFHSLEIFLKVKQIFLILWVILWILPNICVKKA